MVSCTVALILTVGASCYIFYLIKYLTVLNLETEEEDVVHRFLPSFFLCLLQEIFGGLGLVLINYLVSFIAVAILFATT